MEGVIAMKEQYIRQVKHHLYLPRKQKQEVLRDLEEIFASAQEHGETENQVMERLGDPKEYAHEVQKPLDRPGGACAFLHCMRWCSRAVPLHFTNLGPTKYHWCCPRQHIYSDRGRS